MTTPDAGKDVKQYKLSFIAGGNEKWETVWQFLTKLNTLLYNPTITILGLPS